SRFTARSGVNGGDLHAAVTVEPAHRGVEDDRGVAPELVGLDKFHARSSVGGRSVGAGEPFHNAQMGRFGHLNNARLQAWLSRFRPGTSLTTRTWPNEPV